MHRVAAGAKSSVGIAGHNLYFKRGKDGPVDRYGRSWA
jgi:hypothetical protein